MLLTEVEARKITKISLKSSINDKELTNFNLIISQFTVINKTCIK